ncbi:MAG: hypothetical protein IJ612_06615 [Prevotella sp.]|nr:hypothetical protein [Prevotella sp.]
MLGRQGYYYIYNTKGYFVTPSTTYWTLSQTTPAPVQVTLNNANQSALSTTDNIYLFGESSQHANPQNKDNAELVYAYSAHETDKGNNWVLEVVSDATAGSTARRLVFSFDGEDDGIQGPLNDGEGLSMVYTANGMRSACCRRGLNIVRMTDGSYRKVLKKN